MILCPNCNADMRFSPEEQKLKCDYCGCLTEPETYSQSDGLGAKDAEFFDTVIFTCPQCGGDIMSTDDTAATFCSYCGASVILNSRVSKEKCPDFMIPFKIGKNACKEAYLKRVKKAIFAPQKLRSDTEVEKFRGIYMPYWSYNMGVDSIVTAPGETEKREGDYIVTRTYDVSAPVNGTFDGIAFDSSSSFSDNLSEGIAPFNTEEIRPFNPAYLSGFYADNGDVNESTYRADAQEIVKTYVGNCLSEDSVFKKYGVSGSKASEHVPVNTGESQRALYPVWFLSNRTGDRITYAVVNGQTGKVAADIPVDPIKYLIGSLIIAIPLFLIFNILFTFTPGKAMIAALIFDLASIIISWVESNTLKKIETGESDKGYQSTVSKISSAKDDRKKKKLNKMSLVQIILLALGFLVLIIDPTRDIVYYSIVSVILIVTGLSYINIIKQFNLLTTRKLPQLGARGGDEHAE